MASKKNPLRLRSDLILVRPIKRDKTAGGLYLTEDPNYSKKGEVVAAGPGKLSAKGVRLPISVAEKELIFYGPHAGVEVEVMGERLLMMHEDDVIAVVTE